MPNTTPSTTPSTMPNTDTASQTRLVMPGQTNRHGSLFGGIALMLMDETAAIVATRVARGATVTAHIESVDFLAPIWQGEAIEVTARLVKLGSSSMCIHVETWGECLEKGTRRHCTGADFIFVAIDEQGRPRPIPRTVRPAIDQPEASQGPGGATPDGASAGDEGRGA